MHQAAHRGSYTPHYEPYLTEFDKGCISDATDPVLARLIAQAGAAADRRFLTAYIWAHHLTTEGLLLLYDLSRRFYKLLCAFFPQQESFPFPHLSYLLLLWEPT